eukprot:NODE_328_length_9539_cov_0.346716.p5 type:complete len:196 gc:universal NODE_328_length_9539_cov_0.346716:5781-5194(-)
MSAPETHAIPIDQSQGPPESIISRSSHPIALLFHLAFKVAALFMFLFGYFVTGNNYIMVFVICILCLAFDFWTTKNVSGRLLVGLRWWSMEDQWIFESRPNYVANSSDSFLFWSSSLGFLLVWIILAFLYLLQFHWLVICAAAVMLQGSNLYGYYKCKNSKASFLPGGMSGLRMFGAFAQAQAQSSAQAQSPPRQ